MTLNVNLLLRHQSYACFDKRLKLEHAVFAIKLHCTSAICIFSLTTKLKGIPSNLQTDSQLLRLVTQMYVTE